MDCAWSKTPRMPSVRDTADKLIGSFGDLVVFSFHPNKNMTTHRGRRDRHGDAPAAALFEQYRFHGIKRNAEGEVDVLFPGAKSNLTDVAAQIGIDQLRRLDGFNARRRELAGRYFDELEAFRRVVLPARGDSGHSWHMFQVLIDFAARGMTRPGFQKAMADRGIGIGVHYPSIPSLTYYRAAGYRDEDTPVAARVGRETVTLPLFPAMRMRMWHAWSERSKACCNRSEIVRPSRPRCRQSVHFPRGFFARLAAHLGMAQTSSPPRYIALQRDTHHEAL